MSLGVYPQDQGIPDGFYDQLHCSHLKQRIDTIVVGERERELDEKTVLMLMESIEQTGLRQPIGIRITENYDRLLIWGYHRYEAWRRLFEQAVRANDEEGKKRWHMIPCLEFMEGMTEDMAVLLEIQENLDRKDLTDAERKSAMGKKLKLLDRVRGKDGAKTNKGAKGATWHPPVKKTVSSDLGMSQATLRHWYDQYKADHHGKDWNKQSEAEYEGFRQWLIDAEQREAEKAAEEERLKLQGKVKQIQTKIDALLMEYVGLTDNSEVSDWLSRRAEEIS